VKRSNQPIFWLQFGAGGMLSASIGAMLVFITGVAVPSGLGLPPDLMRHENALAFARGIPGKVFLLAVISLFLWHGAHRICHSLHDLGVPKGPLVQLACYGLALAGTLAAVVALFSIGF
jgi:fumarate reductase subunit D